SYPIGTGKSVCVYRFTQVHWRFCTPLEGLTRVQSTTILLHLKGVVEPMVFLHCPIRHGEVVLQVVNSFVAQSVDLSVWQDVQGLGILYLSVIAGEMNLKVCELTKVPGTPWVSIFGMWQVTH